MLTKRLTRQHDMRTQETYVDAARAVIRCLPVRCSNRLKCHRLWQALFRTTRYRLQYSEALTPPNTKHLALEDGYMTVPSLLSSYVPRRDLDADTRRRHDLLLRPVPVQGNVDFVK